MKLLNSKENVLLSGFTEHQRAAKTVQAAAENAIKILGGVVTNQVEFQLPDSDIYRNLFVIEKIKQTQKKYPRKAGLPGKEPL